MSMVVMVVMIVKMRMRHPVVLVLMAVRCTRGNRRIMGMMVVPVPVGVLMRMFEAIVGMRVRMLGN